MVLEQKDISFDEIDIELQPEKREEMITLTGRTSVPQIFINQQPIGGCDDLMALNASGELDNLLSA
jgi:glutaredoxin 3